MGIIGVGATALAFDGTGHLLATGGDENITRLWDVSDAGAPQPRSVLSGSSLGVNALTISGRGQTLAVGSGDGSIRLWDLSDPLRPAPGAVLSGLTDAVDSLAFAAGGSLLVSGSPHSGGGDSTDTGTVRLWPVSGAGRSAAIAQLPMGILGDPAFSPHGSLLAGGFPTTIWRIGHFAQTQQVGTVSTFNQGGQAVAFSPDGHWLVSGYPLVRWDVQDPGAAKALDPTVSRTAMVPWIAYAPDGRTVALPGPNDLELWPANGSAQRPLSTLVGSNLGTYSLNASLGAYSPDAASLATVGKDGQAVVWDISHPEAPVRQSVLGDRDDPVTAVAFSSRPDLLIIGRTTGSVQLWDISHRAQPQLMSSRRRHTAAVGGLAMQPGGQLLASSEIGGRIVLWSLRDPTQPLDVASFTIGGNFSAPTVAFSPDGSMLAASHEGQTVVWDTNITEILGAICARTAPIDQPTWATYLSGFDFDPPCAQPEQRK
jgi:WD40 repeat protein